MVKLTWPADCTKMLKCTLVFIHTIFSKCVIYDYNQENTFHFNFDFRRHFLIVMICWVVRDWQSQNCACCLSQLYAAHLRIARQVLFGVKLVVQNVTTDWPVDSQETRTIDAFCPHDIPTAEGLKTIGLCYHCWRKEWHCTFHCTSWQALYYAG